MAALQACPCGQSRSTLQPRRIFAGQSSVEQAGQHSPGLTIVHSLLAQLGMSQRISAQLFLLQVLEIRSHTSPLWQFWLLVQGQGLHVGQQPSLMVSFGVYRHSSVEQVGTEQVTSVQS